MEYKLLIVDDDRVAREMGRITFEKLGFIVETVDDGLTAIPRMKIWRPDVVILDLELPGKNGHEILQEMFLDPDLRDLIIIANTAHMAPKDELSFAYYVHYNRIKQREPVMVGKGGAGQPLSPDLPSVVADLLGRKFGLIPQPLLDRIKKTHS